jgi:catechol 2,3-dioxygenase-like lactoylglutathione lyase family enzyme
MTLRLDHVVILVDDLERASADYGALGFTVVYGGEHADGVTENALVAFEDGSYLELIHFKRPAPEGHFFERGYKAGEGLIAYALVPDDIERAIAEARERGLEIDGPRAGGRLRPDGTRLEWKIGTPRTPDLPFLCADVTPRELRVPGGKAREHQNGVVGMANIGVQVINLEESVERYKALLGIEPMLWLEVEHPPVKSFDIFVVTNHSERSEVRRQESAHTGLNRGESFTLGSTNIEISAPLDGKPWPGSHLMRYGEGPATLSLAIRDVAKPTPLSAIQAHPNAITLVPEN